MHTRRLWHSIFLYVILPCQRKIIYMYKCISIYVPLSFSFFLTVSLSRFYATLTPSFSLILHLARLISSSSIFSPSPLFLFSFSLCFTMSLLCVQPSRYTSRETTRDSSLDFYTLLRLFTLRYSK